MKLKIIASVLLLAVPLAACETRDAGTKQTGGTLIGAGLGALAGAQVGGGSGKLAAVALGALAGAYLGSEIGQSLDDADRLAMERNAQQSLETAPTGQTSAWRNPDSGHSGTFTPTRTYSTAEQQPCREYQTTVVIDGREESAYGTACRQPDGSWQIAN